MNSVIWFVTNLQLIDLREREAAIGEGFGIEGVCFRCKEEIC